MGIRNSFKIKIVIIAATITAISILSFMNYKQSMVSSDMNMLSVGYYWTSPTLVADYHFSVYKPNIEYKAEVQIARDSVPPIFILDGYANTNLIDRTNHLVECLIIKDETNLSAFVTNSLITLFYQQQEPIQLNEIRKINIHLLPFLQQVYKNGYIDQLKDRFKVSDLFAVRIYPNIEYHIEKALVYDKQMLSIDLQNFCSANFNDTTAPLIVEMFYKMLQPNLTYSEELTNRAMILAEQSVRKTLGMVHKGEIIVERGERLTEQKINIIKSYTNSNIAKEDDYILLKLLGNFGLTTIQYSILIMFIVMLRRKIWEDNINLLILSSTVVIVAFLGWSTFQIQAHKPELPLEYLVLIPALSMFIAITYDSRTAFYTTVSMAMVLAGVRGNDYFIGLTMLFTGSIAAYSVRDIEDRSQLFSSIIFIFIGFVLSIFVIGLERGNTFNNMMPQLLLTLINAITAPVVTFCLLLAFNKYNKGIITNIKLNEYLKSDIDHPLIAELRERTQGTFEHSREVSQLATIVAKAIGANHILVQVGALFHDIGKANNPTAFTENKEQYRLEPHKKLTPHESAKKIISHVINGIEKAKKYNIPQSIIDFIPQHHGTFLVKHFYNVALNEAKDGEIINENDFRYPGPIPQSKETTILMICDFAEAISKASDHFEGFQKLFEENIEERIKDGQFNNSDVSLRELETIKEVLYAEIKGKIHRRVKYAVAKNKEEDKK
ncbi:MAG: HDIG domain-containing protein [Bacteroidetes bacterium]|nr:HDIG domain-containing protein [Bacteroidota bacterium]